MIESSLTKILRQSHLASAWEYADLWTMLAISLEGGLLSDWYCWCAGRTMLALEIYVKAYKLLIGSLISDPSYLTFDTWLSVSGEIIQYLSIEIIDASKI